ncbi:MAG TPA: ATP-dependent Clp protease adaptor ClpS [Ignavibacteria bacterium]|nr:ATP-dependent Clp protease adaptor ClpS [Ignavibacteria bacterium]
MPEVEELVEPIDIDTTTEGFSLILYNDSVHSFEDVIDQVMKATGFGFEKSESITMEAHSRGRAVVITGDLNICVKAQHVLEEISLRTSIEVLS